MDNLVKTMINHMARLTGTTLTARHLEILDYCYRYHRRNRVGPLYRNLQKNTGATREEIGRLFPRGLNSVYSWVGIPIHSADRGCKPHVEVSVEQPRQVYLDHNATTPIRPEVLRKVTECLTDPLGFGNASSSTHLGKKAFELVDMARRRIANTLRARPANILFTGCGSEANNLAIKGVAFRHWEGKGHILTTAVEHPSVLETVRYLETLGFSATYLAVDELGRITPEAVRAHLRPDTILVSVMAANNEIGTIYPVGEIGEVCRDAGVPFMVDAIQGYGKIRFEPAAQNISLLSFSGHKIYAPKGIAALYVGDGLNLVPLVHGGGQEFGLRAGTENVVYIAALGLAADLIHREMDQETARLKELQDYFLKRLDREVPGYRLNGPRDNRLANNLNIGFPGVDSGSLLLSLNQMGVYASAGSACHAGSTEASHVIRAIGGDTRKYGFLRFGLGLKTTREDIDYLLAYLPEILKRLSDAQGDMDSEPQAVVAS